jgi:DNA-binding NarL/FixJ family response regulator
MVSRSSGKRVLLVDDSAVVRGIVKTFLEGQTGVDVCGEAADGVEAVEKTGALKPDLVLLDFSMPRMNGAAAASLIKKSTPETRIILFTIFSENIGKSVTASIGVDAVLSKPDGLAALGEAIEDVFTRPASASAPATPETLDLSSRGADPIIAETAPARAVAVASVATASIAPTERSQEPASGAISFVRLVRPKAPATRPS